MSWEQSNGMWFVLSKNAAVPHCGALSAQGVMYMCPKSQLCCSLTAYKLGRLLPAALSRVLGLEHRCTSQLYRHVTSYSGISRLFL